jgi:hypothetical protein
MKMRVQLVIEDDSGASTCADIAAIERHTDDLIGLSLEEAKAMACAVQRKMVEVQAREAIARGSICPACQQRLRRNGKHRVGYRTPFGRLDLDSPRFYRCRCQTHARQSISPLAIWLDGHISPELQFLEAQFALAASPSHGEAWSISYFTSPCKWRPSSHGLDRSPRIRGSALRLFPCHTSHLVCSISRSTQSQSGPTWRRAMGTDFAAA